MNIIQPNFVHRLTMATGKY